jgi:glycosyltransferase involved in cell wall biosynthesis
MTACDVFCHAAPFEPFGIVCLEAMAVGLPVVVPDSGGIQEAVVHGMTGLIYQSLDVESLARAMIQLQAKQEMRQTLGQAGRSAVEERFSVGGYVERLYTLYGLAG